ncbi:hypothetical protein JKP88DRAFT_352499 [Tribonema minus]|uniref:ADF-H domain-containing protein n=1 Tax=Tribonema minus TaxID=303371 RepID=A0A836CLE6_9STRA|nr:hypothetical protein JKP88DRAFT_352499 [Tribonema minus]
MQVGDAKALHTTQRSSGLDVSSPELAAAWQKVRSKSDSHWCLFGYGPGGNTQIVVTAAGSDGFEGLRSSLTDSMAAWAGLRVSVLGSTKFVRLAFIGTEIAGMKRAKASLHRNAVFHLFEGGHCDVTFDGDGGLDAFTSEAVVGAVAEALRVEPPPAQPAAAAAAAAAAATLRCVIPRRRAWQHLSAAAAAAAARICAVGCLPQQQLEFVQWVPGRSSAILLRSVAHCH